MLTITPLPVTLHHYRTGKPLVVNAALFTLMERLDDTLDIDRDHLPSTFIKFAEGKDRAWVSETPEEVTALIREAAERRTAVAA